MTVITIDKLKQHLISMGQTSESHFQNKVIDGMLEAMKLLFLSVKDKLQGKYGCFEIFGVDFLLAEDLTPRLMEITSNPSYVTEMEDSMQFTRTLLRDTITMVADLHQIGKKEAPTQLLEKAFRCAQ